MYKFISILVLLLASQCNTAHAGTQSGKIKHLMVRASDGLVLFELENTGAEKPACATHSYWIIADEKSVTGKQQLAVLLAARASDQVVSISGSNKCTRWVDGEDVDLIIL